jgi:hypothetical protein
MCMCVRACFCSCVSHEIWVCGHADGFKVCVRACTRGWVATRCVCVHAFVRVRVCLRVRVRLRLCFRACGGRGTNPNAQPNLTSLFSSAITMRCMSSPANTLASECKNTRAYIKAVHNNDT